MPQGIYKRIKHWRVKDTSKMSKSHKGKHWKVKNTSKYSEARKKEWTSGTRKHISSQGFQKGHRSNRGGFQKGHKSFNGIEKSQFKKGSIPWNKDRPFLQIKGKNHPNWKGGHTPENIKIRMSLEYKLWRKAVFLRDNFTCQKHKIRGGKLVAHHINNFSDFMELRLALDNGITLSEKAHREFHKKYGKKNNTRDQLIEFLNNKI